MNNGNLTGLFFHCTARNNDEYKKHLKKRRNLMTILLICGSVILFLTLACSLFQPELLKDSHYTYWFCGLSTGLIFGSVVSIIKLNNIMKSEERLKEARLEETDEREREIFMRSLRMTAGILLLSLYLLLFVCSFVELEALTVLYLLIAEFFLSYLVCRKRYGMIL